MQDRTAPQHDRQPRPAQTSYAAPASTRSPSVESLAAAIIALYGSLDFPTIAAAELAIDRSAA